MGKNNINSFGGDANNVTIFGESAGGHNVLSLLVTKKPKDFFIKLYQCQDIQLRFQQLTHILHLKNLLMSKFSVKTFNQIIKRKDKELNHIKDNHEKIREMLLNIPAEEFSIYAEREPYEEIPLLTSDEL